MHLLFSEKINHVLYVLPNSLTYLHLGNDFNHVLDLLPKKLIYLYLDMNSTIL